MQKFVNLRKSKFILLRYLLVGAWNSVFSLILFYLLIITLGDSYYEVILFITFIVSTIQSYVTQKYFVWRIAKFQVKEFGHFFLTALFQYMINALVMYYFVGSLHLSPKIVQVPVSLTIALSSYIYFKKRVFKSGV
jgi:putative flippase GtrA